MGSTDQMLSYGLWSRHIHRPQQSPPSSGNSHSFSQKLQARKMLQQTFSHTLFQTHIYIHLNYTWRAGSGKWRSPWTDVECVAVVDLHSLHSDSLSIPAQGSACSPSLDVQSSLAKQHRGRRHEDRGALEKAIMWQQKQDGLFHRHN